MTFQELPLKESLLKAITERGYVQPTEIQEKAIPELATKDIDFVGQAQTGTGKTAAFVLPLLNKIDPAAKSVQALILTPTRELANQVCEEIQKFSTYEKIKTTVVYGGVSLEGQIRSLRKDKPQIVVGTPGRVIDLLERDVLILDYAKYAILDEADEMLDMGFFDDVQDIIARFPEEKVTWMFSATMPGPIMNLIQNELKDPMIVRIRKKTATNENIEQKHFVVRPENMTEAVCRILDGLEDYYGMIFCRTKVDAKMLADELNVRGYPSDSLHGDMSQQQRDITMKNFKNKKINMLVCTDVAARGIDVDNLTHVINYGLPQDIESYVHRIGRTGRAGQTGIALSLVEPSERRKMGQIESITKAKIVRATLPTIEDLKDVLIRKELKKMQETLSHVRDGSIDLSAYNAFAEGVGEIEKDEALKILFTHLFKTRIDRYNNSSQLDVVDRDRRDARDGRRDGDRDGGPRGQASRSDNVRLFVNIGREHGVTLRSLLSTVSGLVNVDERYIRNVDLKNEFSFLEVPTQLGDALLNHRGATYGDRKLRFELTRGGPTGGGRGGYSRGGGDRYDRGGDRGDRGGDRGGDRFRRGPSRDRSFRS